MQWDCLQHANLIPDSPKPLPSEKCPSKRHYPMLIEAGFKLVSSRRSETQDILCDSARSLSVSSVGEEEDGADVEGPLPTVTSWERPKQVVLFPCQRF